MPDRIHRWSRSRSVGCLASGILVATACQSPTPAVSPTPNVAATSTTAPALSVVATTSIVGDVVTAVGGARVAVAVLIAPGTDPHDYKPTPGDLFKVESAAIVFENGIGLEGSLDAMLGSAGGHASRVAVSEGIATIRGDGGQGARGGTDGGDADAATPDNPHVWWDPVRVKVWVANIAVALSAADPHGAATYAANADAYTAELTALDDWIREQTATIPSERRVLITDHELLGYFATAYGFTVIGTVIPGISTAAEPSAKDLSALEAAIRASGVRVIFSGEPIPAALAARVAADTGTRLVTFFGEALSGPDGPAATYLAFMRHNVKVIVEALR